MQSQAKAHLGAPEAGKQSRTDSPLEPLEGEQPAYVLVLDFWPTEF